MRRVVGRLLLAAAVALPLSVAISGQPAEGSVGSSDGTAVMKCHHFKDAMILSPGLSNTPANQTVEAHGRVYGCNKAGGGGHFAASFRMTNATCANRRMHGGATFSWANGTTSTAFLTFTPAPVAPSKVEVEGVILKGQFKGLLVHSFVRFTDSFKGTGPGCSATNLLKRIDFANSQSLQLFLPVTTTTTVPHGTSFTTTPHTTTPHTTTPHTTTPHTTTPHTFGPRGTTAATAPPATSPPPSGGGGGGVTQATAGPSSGGSLAFTGANSAGALFGAESLMVGGALWALGDRGRRHDRTGRGKRRTRRHRGRPRPWLVLTLPPDVR